jgi:NAD(P)-dependent dehydrogenase (short-subunit alcohol dehydrogenase family)
MNNKICLITGANSGIGKVTARELARQGMTVLMVCRDITKGEEAQNEIIVASGNKEVKLYQCDLSKQADIVKLSQTIHREYDRLDILINNAGGILPQRKTTADGYEMTFAVNHLAPFLLTQLLLDLIKKGNEPRIITVSSEAHKMARLDFNDLQAEKSYSSWVAYGNSKLANILFTKQLAKEVKEFGITANCLHPGVVATGFGGGYTSITGAFFSLFRPFFIDAEKGAETSIYLASSPEVKGKTGLYFKKKKPNTPSKEALSDYNAEKLWEVSLALTHAQKHINQVKTA